MNRTSIIAAVSGIVERSFQETRSLGGGVTIHDMETAAWKAARQFGQLMIQAQADEAGNGYMGSRIPCECGAKMRYVDTRSRTVTTWCGQMMLRRAYYRCDSCGTPALPLDKQLCMPAGHFSESIIEAIGYCSAQLPFECASETLERLTGISVSPKEAQILSEGIGAEMDEELKEQAQIAITHGLDSASNPDRLYITIDGVMVRELDGWHETKVSAIYDGVSEAGSDGVYADVANDITYVARKAPPDEFGACVSAEAQQRGEANAAEVIALGDGAVWIWNLVDAYFPEAVQIIDWYHASEHVWRFARVVYDGNEDRCKSWVDEQLELLSNGRVEELVGRLRAMTGLRDEASAGGSEKVLNLRTYALNGKRDEFWRNRRARARSGAQGQPNLLRAA